MMPLCVGHCKEVIKSNFEDITKLIIFSNANEEYSQKIQYYVKKIISDGFLSWNRFFWKKTMNNFHQMIFWFVKSIKCIADGSGNS